ncbi:hypothetical protein [Ornithinibacillus contaminans]|uniref:hypothetical protein n=1 Tax=Ornithinibacillus contaminans TaxID=694055 RepID=UPI00064DFADA|nr:hypothetical protein [Ornithinibacillus contaminans]
MKVTNSNTLLIHKNTEYLPNQTKAEASNHHKSQNFHEYLERSNTDSTSLTKLNYAYTNGSDFIKAKASEVDLPLLTLEEIKSTFSDQESALALTPGTKIKLSSYTNPAVYVTVEKESVSISTDTTPLGRAYVNEFNTTVREMLNVTNSNEIPDLSKLSKEDLAIVKQMQQEHADAVKGIGGEKQYQSLHAIAESLDDFIRFANGQSHSVSVEDHENIKSGLEMMGIDTSQPFYINGNKIEYGENGFVRSLQ